MDYNSAYKALKERAKMIDDEVLVTTSAYKMLSAAYPHAARATLLEARLRKLEMRKAEASSFSEKLQIERDIARSKRELKRELLFRRPMRGYLRQKSGEQGEAQVTIPRGIKTKIASGINAKRRMGGEWFRRTLPPSISYLGTWGFSSKELIQWSKGYLQGRSVKSKPWLRK
jgi:hypothetical protein